MELFQADRRFRPIPITQVQPVNTSTTSTITFSDIRLVNGFKYFVRFFTESGGLFSGESEFLEFVPVGVVGNARITETGDVRITESGDTRIIED